MKLQFPFTLLTIGFLMVGVSAQLADSPWPMLRRDAQHTGISPYDTSHVDGTLMWKFNSGWGMEASPVIGEDGTIYIATHGNNLHAIYPNGTERW
ncbi:MAG: PQQ-like beta-propeller repeat protein, partial [Candidatus Altiarchaeota archaeon]|nr:PQQ-like beta-propeller repeat protein [Candidatus Altiarchaeota archaeon]